MAIYIGSVVYVRNTEFSVVGIDYYTLLNTRGQKVKWTSFTIKNKNKRKWLIKDINNKDILWEKAEQLKIVGIKREYMFNPSMSGIATILFKGKRGFSTPMAEILWFDIIAKNSDFDYYVQENFFEFKKNNLASIKRYYYRGKSI